MQLGLVVAINCNSISIICKGNTQYAVAISGLLGTQCGNSEECVAADLILIDM